MSVNNTRSDWPLATSIVTSLVLLTMAFYRQTVMYLASIWGDVSTGEYAHGYLVLVISIFLIVFNRKKLARLAPCPSYSVLPLVFFNVLLLTIAVLVDVEVLQAAALLSVVFTVMWVVYGHQIMSVLAFPILFIFFAIPVWFPLSPLLQNITADAVFWVVRLIDVPAFRHENFITVPSGVFSIEEACSGLRYLLAALTLGSLYAYINYVSLAGRVAVVLVAASAALLANIVRVFIVVYLGYATEMQHPWVGDHLMLGWYLFGGLVAILLFIDARYYRHASPVKNTATDDTAEEGCTGVSAKVNKSCQKGRAQYFIIAGLCVVTLSIGPVIMYQQNQQQQLLSASFDIVLPEGPVSWSSSVDGVSDWMPQYHGAINKKSDYLVRGERVSIFIAYYPFQQQGKEVINDLNRISNKKIWRLKYPHARVKHLQSQDFLEQIIGNEKNENRLVWYWYNIGGNVTINKYEAKLWQLAGMLSGRPQAYVAAVSVPVNDDVENARKFIRNIVSDLKISLENWQVTNE